MVSERALHQNSSKKSQVTLINLIPTTQSEHALYGVQESAWCTFYDTLKKNGVVTGQESMGTDIDAVLVDNCVLRWRENEKANVEEAQLQYIIINKKAEKHLNPATW